MEIWPLEKLNLTVDLRSTTFPFSNDFGSREEQSLIVEERTDKRSRKKKNYKVK